MTRKPVPMKPTLAWAVVNQHGGICWEYRDGFLEISRRKKGLTLFDDERIQHVEIREVQPKRRRKT